MIKRLFITKSIDIFEFESVSEWGYQKHKHNFFELTFILEGKGQHILNENVIDYKSGDLFFLTAKDEHEFVVSEATRFGLIKFTEQLFLEKTEGIGNARWKKNIEPVIFHSNVIAKSIIVCRRDKKQVFALYHLIKNELENNTYYSRNVLLELFGALLIIISRNLKSSLGELPKTLVSEKARVDRILTYIRQNILDKDRIRIKNIAKEFYMSTNYVSIFIKKHAGISIQKYVVQSKMKMAERLLKQSNLNISEVAEKIGFSDSSHFNKMFKKYYGKSPSKYI